MKTLALQVPVYQENPKVPLCFEIRQEQCEWKGKRIKRIKKKKKKTNNNNNNKNQHTNRQAKEMFIFKDEQESKQGSKEK